MTVFGFLLASFGFWGYLFQFMLIFLSILLILIVLVQRGRGGGLTGALGGPGGQSAFGSRAGDLFTKITCWVAGIWILLCLLAIINLAPKSPLSGPDSAATKTQTQKQQSDKSGAAPTGSGTRPQTPADGSGSR